MWWQCAPRGLTLRNAALDCSEVFALAQSGDEVDLEQGVESDVRALASAEAS